MRKFRNEKKIIKRFFLSKIIFCISVHWAVIKKVANLKAWKAGEAPAEGSIEEQRK